MTPIVTQFLASRIPLLVYSHERGVCAVLDLGPAAFVLFWALADFGQSSSEGVDSASERENIWFSRLLKSVILTCLSSCFTQVCILNGSHI